MKKARILLATLVIVGIGSFGLSSCSGERYTFYDPQPIPEYKIPNDEINIALVLGGGGSRGIAHLGVLSVLEEENIPIDLIVGTSAGSVVGAMYADSLTTKPIVANYKEKTRKHLLDFDVMNLRYGIYKGEAFRNFLEQSLSVTHFHQLKIPTIVVATDLISGEEIAFGSGEIAPVVHASCALPYFFHPVEIYGRPFVDGGVTNPIPVSVAKRHNPRLTVAVDVTQSLPRDLPTNLVGIAKRSAEICFQKINTMCLNQADVIITPDVKSIDTFEDKAFEELYQAGREAGRAALPQIRAHLEGSRQAKQVTLHLEGSH